MNTIFLDVDGVLNSSKTKDKIKRFRGIEDKKVSILKEICDYCNCEIILSSSWKDTWDKDKKYIQDEFANYLDKKLYKQGLKILDKTQEKLWAQRGHGIINYIKNNSVNFWLVLDDEPFKDYYHRYKINGKWDTVNNHWINTGKYEKYKNLYDFKNHIVTDLRNREEGLIEEDLVLCKKIYDNYRNQ